MPQTKKRKMSPTKSEERTSSKKDSGVICISNLPYGFFENELKGYFSQFGTVEQVRVARSKKTGNSQGFAFVKFSSSRVAQIAARAMDNYLMFDELLKCRYVPPKKVHPGLFTNDVEKETTREKAARLFNASQDKGEEFWMRWLERKHQQLAAIGIDYRLELPMKTAKKFKAVTGKLKAEKAAADPETDPGLGHTKEEEPEAFIDSLDFDLDDTLNEAYTMILDSSEDEVTFRTPPPGVVIRRREKPWKKYAETAIKAEPTSGGKKRVKKYRKKAEQKRQKKQ